MGYNRILPAPVQHFRDKMASDQFSLVAAIDIGTTYSGYAFSTVNDFLQNPTKIDDVESQTFQTCVLYTPSRSFDSFGYDAEEKYINLEDHDEWYFFTRFKMSLYNSTLDRDVQITDFSGKKRMPLKVILSDTINYLKLQVLGKCKERNITVDGPAIRWVLTVPSIWNDQAKQLMREAARKVGIRKRQLILALEPEAASIFHKYENLAGEYGAIQAGIEYMVVDAGGGIVDIVVHEVQNDGKQAEVVASTGGAYGGTVVNDAFESLLEDIVGKQTLDQFKSHHISDFFNLMRSFEVEKMAIGEDPTDMVKFNIPASLLSTYNSVNPGENIEENINNQNLSSHVGFHRGQLWMSGSKAESLFNESVENITDHIKKLLEDPNIKGISFIVLAEGYSESPLLVNRIQAAARGIKLHVIGEDMAVLKGAVIFGHSPGTISERISRFTYGVDTWSRFVEGKHKEEYKVTAADGSQRCKFAFSTFVRKGDSVKTDKISMVRKYTPAASSQNGMNFTIYASEEEPVHVTDPSCKKIGKFTIDLPETTGGLDRTVCVMMRAGGTEIDIKAIEEDTERCCSTCDFLI